MTILTRSALTALLMILLAVPVAQAESEAEVRAAIEVAIEDLIDSLRAGDVVRMASHYTDDTVLYAYGQAPIKGRDGALEHFEYVVDAGIDDVTYRVEEIFVDDDTAVEIGYARFWRNDSDKSGRIRYMTLWKKVDGEWRIHRDMASP